MTAARLASVQVGGANCIGDVFRAGGATLRVESATARERLEFLAACPALSAEWRRMFAARLEAAGSDSPKG